MKYRQLEVSHVFNEGNYESERIGLIADLSEAEDIDEAYKTLKAMVFRLHEKGKLLEQSKVIVEADRRLESVRQNFPEDLRQLLVFEETPDAAIVKPKEFLGSDNFAKIASIVRNLKGEYISAGKDSHFEIPKNV